VVALAGVLGAALQAQGHGAAAIAGAVGAVALLAGFASARAVRVRTAGVAEICQALERVAAGDTSSPLTASRAPELAPAVDAVNQVMRLLDRTRKRVRDLSSRLGQLPGDLGAALAAARTSAESQEAAVEETAALQANINHSISSINEEVENLAHSNEESASSILQLGSAVEQVARSAAALQQTVESSSTSLEQMGSSIRTVARSADSVQVVAEETAAAVTEMDRSLQEVGLHVRSASELTERVSERAEQGSRAVGSTIDGIAEIREATLAARSVLANLAEGIGEIGEIATVIGAITDETQLLSLNAAIIAAQAGEQGRAFAVVADQVKTLARRTNQSTGEIEALIRSVQEQSQRATEAMAAGIEAVEQGVERSRAAGDTLSTIQVAAREASGRVAEIARAADEQARNSKQVAEAARRTSEHVQEISSAMTQQSQASDQLLENSHSSVEMCRQMTAATEEQRASSRYITSNIEAITALIRSIQASTRAHERSSTAVAGTFAAILESARNSVEDLPRLAASIEELQAHAASLHAELQSFGAATAPPDQSSDVS
jgi:methyl-accepting chemotaxis protein